MGRKIEIVKQVNKITNLEFGKIKEKLDRRT